MNDTRGSGAVLAAGIPPATTASPPAPEPAAAGTGPLRESAPVRLAPLTMVASAGVWLLGATLAALSADAATVDWPAFLGLTAVAAVGAALLARLLTPARLPAGRELATLLVQLDRLSVAAAVLPGAVAVGVALLLAVAVLPALGVAAPALGLVLLTLLAAAVALPGLQGVAMRRVERASLAALQPGVDLTAQFAAVSPPRPLVSVGARVLIVLVGLVVATAVYVGLSLVAAGPTPPRALPALLAGLGLLLGAGLLATYALLADWRERLRLLQQACDEVTAGHEVATQPGFALDELGAMSHAIRRISEAQQALGERIQRVAEGHLHVEFRGRSRLGAALRQLVDKHRGLVAQVQETVTQARDRAAETERGTVQVAHLLTEQADTLQQATRAMQQLQQAAERLTQDAVGLAQSATQSLETVERSARQFDSLVEHQAHIEELLDTVKEIGDRSDILALNASLEGVRAGEAGRGFSLVAVEMRRMAERVKHAAEDIRAIVANGQQAAQATRETTHDGRQLGQALADAAQRLAWATQQQQTGAGQAQHAVEQVADGLAELAGDAAVAQSRASRLHTVVREMVERLAGYRESTAQASVSDEAWSYTEMARMMLGPVESGRLAIPTEWRLPLDDEGSGEAGADTEEPSSAALARHARPAVDAAAAADDERESRVGNGNGNGNGNGDGDSDSDSDSDGSHPVEGGTHRTPPGGPPGEA